MSQDFRRANLRGQSFRGHNLSKVDFSYADICGVDFTNAVLVGADFTHSRAGLRRQWAISLIIGSLTLAFVAGLDAAYGGVSVGVLLVHQGIQSIDFLFSGIALLILLGFSFLALRRGWGSEIGGLALIVAAAIAFVAAVGTSDAIAGAVIQAVAIAGVVAGTVTGALVTAIVRVIAGKGVLIALAVLALFGVVVGAGLGIPQDNPEVIVPGSIAAIISTLSFFLLSFHAANRSLAGDRRYALISSMTTAICAGKGTSFRNADLTNANFTQALLKHTDLRGAILARTNWFQANGLSQARIGRTYLENREVRELLISKEGKGKNFDRCDLRGVNLQNANLSDSSLIGADLSEATLQSTDLSRAKLVQTQLYRTDLTYACLTGAHIQDWAISTDTNFQDVRCEYIYMRLPTQADPDPWRKPDNRHETFKEDDFSDFIAPIVKTLDLYRQQNIDPRQVASTFKTLDLYHYEGIDPSAAAIALKQLAEAHPEADLEVVALEGRGEDKIRLQARVTDRVDQSQLNAEYFEKYRQVSSLPYSDVQTLLAGIAEKDERIRSLEKMVITAIESNKSYIETYYSLGDTVTEKSSININAGGDIGNVSGISGGDVSGVLNLGTISGNVTNAINQLPESPKSDEPGIKDLLRQLQEIIETDTELPQKGKETAVTQVQVLAEVAQDPEQPEKKDMGRQAINLLKGAASFLPDTAKLAEACTKLLPLIGKLLGLPI
ncbi:MAG: pentapeptide repeat-containing protein [Gloeocapsa sp. UFS-A4-WI-NPMV-4B04]|jgi:uncharacterized protein YjbI with pentapeptide repeats|nr:pentapeptide repeat-containing protein [Gloeocapsa sp. UFS-A4-WI-NPMV-4B04]